MARKRSEIWSLQLSGIDEKEKQQISSTSITCRKCAPCPAARMKFNLSIFEIYLKMNLWIFVNASTQSMWSLQMCSDADEQTNDFNVFVNIPILVLHVRLYLLRHTHSVKRWTALGQNYLVKINKFQWN